MEVFIQCIRQTFYRWKFNEVFHTYYFSIESYKPPLKESLTYNGVKFSGK